MSMNALLVEDDEFKRKKISEFIETEPWVKTVSFAASVSGAIQIIDSSSVGIVLLDMAVPTSGRPTTTFANGSATTRYGFRSDWMIARGIIYYIIAKFRFSKTKLAIIIIIRRKFLTTTFFV